jgi:hypothetical protein
MSETPPPKPVGSDEDASLEYRDGRLDRPERKRQVIEAVGGFMIGCLAVIVGGISVTMSNIHYTPSTQPAAWQTNQFEWRGPLNCSLVCVATVAVTAVLAARAGRRAFAAGAAIGVGVTLLIEGACFALNLW